MASPRQTDRSAARRGCGQRGVDAIAKWDQRAAGAMIASDPRHSRDLWLPADMDPSTTTLVAAAARAPRDGFAALHERAARPLFLWAALHVAPPLRAWLPLDDFVQEVWARAYAAFPGYDAAKGPFRGWLYGIAYNVLREQLRLLRVRGRAPVGDGTAAEPLDPGTSVGARAQRAEGREALLLAIDQLDETDRRVAVWRGLEGLPHAEVGRRLGLNAVAAESHWRRVLARLQAVLPAGLLAD
jgi:RNA polymerase sigma factor (sigma-70 family)